MRITLDDFDVYLSTRCEVSNLQSTSTAEYAVETTQYYIQNVRLNELYTLVLLTYDLGRLLLLPSRFFI